MSDVDSELKDLLRDKAEEVRFDPSLPRPVLRRARRRRALNAMATSAVVAGVAVGAFLGARAALNGNTVAAPQVPTGQPATHELWFTQGRYLFFTTQETTDTPEGALQTLLRGPSEEQAGVGVSSAIPSGTDMTSFSIEDGTARVELDPPPGTGLEEAQVVYTLTQFSAVQRVQFQIPSATGGNAQPQLLTREDYASYLPAILVEHPQIGDTVTSPVTISGTADVYEATVAIQIYSEEEQIADTFTAAKCGTGCRGEYTAKVDFSVPKETSGTIVLFEPSGENGQPTNMVRIPVTLEPNPGSTTPPGMDVWVAPGAAAQDPVQTATVFAKTFLGWANVHMDDQTTEHGGVIDLWDEDMTSTFTRDTATELMMDNSSGIWAVQHVTSGLFDVTCPSNMQDGFVTTSTEPICGTFSQTPAGWTVTAIIEYAESNLQGSEAQSTNDITVQGQDFHGTVPLISTYAGHDVSLQIKVYSGSGHLLGMYARRFVTNP